MQLLREGSSESPLSVATPLFPGKVVVAIPVQKYDAAGGLATGTCPEPRQQPCDAAAAPESSSCPDCPEGSRGKLVAAAWPRQCTDDAPC